MQQYVPTYENAIGIELAGERRQVTALFYDIVSSTELLLESDPEEFAAIQSEVHRQAADVIHSHHGFVHQTFGDGSSCYFGYPLSLEDSAENAIGAALALVARCAKQFPPRVKLRIGVASGVVVIKAEGREIVGTAPVLASRLQTQAEPNSVLVSDSTYQMTRRGFAFEFVREARLKGFAEATPIWRPVAEARAADRFSTRRRSEQPLLGRSAELATLRGAWAEAVAGTGRALFVLGDGGIGKSRLVAELRRAVERDVSGEVMLFQCQPRAANRPLHPLMSQFDRILAETPGEPAGNGQARRGGAAPALTAWLAAQGTPLAAETLQPLIRFVAARPDHDPAHLQADPADKRSRDKVIAAAVELLCARATAAPQLIVFEDAHWADSMTWDLIERLNLRAAALPVLVLVTQRTATAERPIDLPGATGIRLAGLSKPPMGELVASLWNGPVPRGLAAFVLDKSDGVPLFGEELVTFLAGKAEVGSGSGDWERLLKRHGISTLNDLVSARLADLGPVRRTAQVASVIGREFTATLLARLSDVARQPGLVESELDGLVGHGILEVRSEADQTVYRFRHSLLQEAAYASLLHSDARIIHQRIAEIVVAGVPTGLPDDLAAWHCALGGYPADAVAFAVRAAEACVVRWAIIEADRLLTMAEEQLALVAAGPKRTPLLLDVLELRGLVAAATHGEGSEETRAVYETAMAICRRQPGRSAGDRFALYWGWWFTAPSVASQQARARTLLKDMQTAKDPEIRLQSFHCAWATNFHAGRHEFCLTCVEEGLALYDPGRALRNRAIFGGHDAKVCGLGERALSLALTGAGPASQAAMAACIEWAEEIDHVGSLLHALYYALAFHRCRRDYEPVIAIADRMRAIADTHDIAPGRAKADMYGGWAEVVSGAGDGGMRRFEDGLRLQLKAGIDDNMAMRLDIEAEVMERAGHTAKSLALLDQAIMQSSRMGQLFWLPELYRRQATLRAALGESAKTLEPTYRRALDIARRQGASELVERVQADLRALGLGERS